MPTSNNNQTSYPSANAVLLENVNSHYASPAMATAVASTAAKEQSSRDQYATAQVVGSDVSPFSSRLIHATETHATATALDPWSKQKTVASETEERQESERPTFFYQAPASLEYTSPNDYNYSNNNNRDNTDITNGTMNLPAAALEDPLHKKYRRRIRRRGRMIAGGAVGVVVGSILLGPVGAIAFGLGGASVARTASKAGEKRKDRRVRRQVQLLQQQHQRGQLQRVVISRR